MFLPVLHDPLTIYALLPENDIKFQSETDRIEIEGRYTRGMRFCEPHRLWGRHSPEPNAIIASGLDKERFIQYPLSRVFGSKN